MKLQSPFLISARLMPALNIDGVTISYNWGKIYFDGPGWEYEEKHFAPGAACNLQQAFAAILGFLSAYAEARGYFIRTGRESDNLGLFPDYMGEWADKNSDEFSLLEFELQSHVYIEE